MTVYFGKMNQATDKILIGTSIVPGQRLDVQRAAVESWLSLGFKVVSFNHRGEIARLDEFNRDFPDLEFIPLVRTAMLLANRPVPYISDMIGYFKSTTLPISGIINSDIIFDQNPDLEGFVRQQAAEGFFYGARLDVASLDATVSRPDPYGFDYFFFPPDMNRVWPESHFCLGMPFWDHWFPLMPLLAGHAMRKPAAPIARHADHEVSRDDSFFMFSDEFTSLCVTLMSGGETNFGDDFAWGNYAALRLRAQQDGGDETERMARLTALAEYFDSLTRYVIAYLDRNTEKVSL